MIPRIGCAICFGSCSGQAAGAAFRCAWEANGRPAVAELGRRLTRILDEIAFPPDRPFVILVQENVGKILGQYVTRWGALPLQIMVIDEVALRDAQFVQIGLPRHQIVPVSFYGLGPDGHGGGS